MVNYQQGKIYKIVCNMTGMVYVGSTCEQRLSQRLARHVLNYKKFLNAKYCDCTSLSLSPVGSCSDEVMRWKLWKASD